MTAEPLALCADGAACARNGERVEVFARRTQTTMARLVAGQDVHDQLAEGWLVGVRSVVDGRYGLAATNTLTSDGLRAALDEAREIRRLAPQPWIWDETEQRVAVAVEPNDERPDSRHNLRPALHQLIRQTRGIAGTEPTTITAGCTYRSVAWADSAGGAAAYRQREAQLHIRSAAVGLDSAQGARIRADVGELPAPEVAAEYRRSLDHLSGPVIAVPRRLDWLALSPLVVARMISRLSMSFLRTAPRPVSTGAASVLLASPAVTMVDDGRPGAGLAGSPFDDEGTPRRRTVLIQDGRAHALLGSHQAGPTTGNAFWAGWSSEMTVATTNCFLEPTVQDSAPELAVLSRPGTGFAAEDIRGFRSGLSLTSAQIEFELVGAIRHDGAQVGTCRLAVSTAPTRLLQGFLEVLPGTEFYRITGLYGGSWCLVHESMVRNDT